MIFYDMEGTYTYDYNENGAMTRQTYQYGASRLSYDYGQLDNRDRQTLTVTGLQYYLEYTVNYDRAHNRAASASINMGRGCATYQRNMSYEYDAKGQVTGFTYHTYDAVYGYDEMGRLTNKTAEGYGETIQNEEYIYNTYTKDGVLYTTNRLAHIEDKTSKSEDRTTTYDENGYITGISYNGNSYEYTYDAVGRITQEKKNGTVQGSYTYDGANNIQKSGLAYTDGELTSVNGAPIEYDEMGNPTTYKGQAFRWEQGRKLAAGTLNGNNFAYEYDGNGMRFKKTVNGKSTEYYYNGTELLAENRNGERIYYIYGATGIEGIEIADICYYFDKNTLGDIVAIRNRSGAVVAKYEYDAWGNVTVTDAEGKEETSAEFIGNKNPIRYRGYYYDAETGFYYLQTRYYDPEICRFINADDYELIATLAEIPGQLNLYAYCNNNPVMLTDESGEFVLLSFLIGLGISAAIGASVGAVSYVASEAISSAITGEWNWSWYDFAGSVIGGFIGGAISMLPGSPVAAAFVSGFSSSMISTGLQSAIEGTNYNFGENILKSLAVGVFSAVTGKIMGTIKIPGLNKGRGSFEQVTKQIRTKFFNAKKNIYSIRGKTFAKMFTVELYGSALGSLTDGIYSAFD